jgi:indole-3-glycerol phosphate synthase
LATDIETTIELAPHVSANRLLVTESGIRTHEDVKRLAAVGAHCLLVGESLLRQEDLVEATRSLLGRGG